MRISTSTVWTTSPSAATASSCASHVPAAQPTASKPLCASTPTRSSPIYVTGASCPTSSARTSAHHAPPHEPEEPHIMERTLTIAACLAAVFSVPALAQDYPAKPITVVVSYSAGGNNDLRARQLAAPVSQALGKPIVTDNRPGASGNIGHALVARAAP